MSLINGSTRREAIHTAMDGMQTLKYKFGIWTAEAVFYELGNRSRMAIISAMAGHGEGAIQAKHTVVFDHASGCDAVEEAKGLIQRVLMHSH